MFQKTALLNKTYPEKILTSFPGICLGLLISEAARKTLLMVRLLSTHVVLHPKICRKSFNWKNLIYWSKTWVTEYLPIHTPISIWQQRRILWLWILTGRMIETRTHSILWGLQSMLRFSCSPLCVQLKLWKSRPAFTLLVTNAVSSLTYNNSVTKNTQQPPTFHIDFGMDIPKHNSTIWWQFNGG